MAVGAVSLDLARGEVLALLGENGAGKSTLVSILFGHYRADEGRIEVNGRVLPAGNTRAALAAGIVMVHQHFTLADNLSVLDNVMLGTEPLWQLFSRRKQARRALLSTAQRYGLQVDPDALVAKLSVGERQRVEILKALTPRAQSQAPPTDQTERSGATVLILDEPTAVLTPSETESLFATLKQLVASGLSVIFISHKLDEVLRVSNRVAVLRGGKLVATVAAAGASRTSLAELMVGREIAPVTRTPKDAEQARGKLVCAVRQVSTQGAGLKRVNLSLHAGEVLAIAGVAGNGQQALAELLFGLRAATEGTVELNGKVMPARPQAWVQAEVARIPEDRHAVGTVGDMAVWENAMLERYATPAFARFGLTRRTAAQSHARDLVQRFDVRGTQAMGLATPTRLLSGGNMQKLILGRALGTATATNSPCLIVADQPTWGLDVGALAFVHQQLLNACAQGAAVLLISEDLDETFALADRVAVMHNGQLSEARPAREWSLSDIGLAMAGLATAGLTENSSANEQLHAH